MGEADTSKRDRVRAYILEHRTTGLVAIMEACECGRSLAQAVRNKLVVEGEVDPLPRGAAAHANQEATVTKPKKKQHETQQPDDAEGGGQESELTPEEVAQNLAYYEARCAELAEACADLAIENMRLRRASEG